MEFIEYIKANWQQVVEYAFIVLSYLLVFLNMFLNGNSVKNAKVTMRDLFSNSVKQVDAKAEQLATQNKRITRLEKTLEKLLDCNTEVSTNDPE